MNNQIKIGDIIEIQTGRGAVYAQFYHYHSAPPNFGALLRILPGFFSRRPATFENLAGEKEVFSTFFPLQAAVNRGLVKIVANETVPVPAQAFPLFRSRTLKFTSHGFEKE